MLHSCPTVRIKAKGHGPRGFVIINESDFDSKTMKLWKSGDFVAAEDSGKPERKKGSK